MDRVALSCAVHDLRQARLCLSWAASGGHRVDLFSAPEPAAADNALAMGGAYWAEVERLLDRPLVIDGGSEAGPVLAALRAGATRVRFDVSAAQAQALRGFAEAQGAVVVERAADLVLRPGANVLAQLARWRMERANPAW